MSRRGERLLNTQQDQMKLQALQWGKSFGSSKYKGKAENKVNRVLFSQ